MAHAPRPEPEFPSMEFHSNAAPTLGVEVEFQLVNPQTCELSSSIDDMLARFDEEEQARFKPELTQCSFEVNTGVCRTVDEVRADLASRYARVARAAGDTGLKVLAAGTHPSSHWQNQRIVEAERYQGLVWQLQYVARRLLTFGLHVHVGVDSGDKAVAICDHILRYVPHLLALSASSPFWCGKSSGLASTRIKVVDSLPTAGLPYIMRNWSEYVWLVRKLVETGFIHSVREIWWDVRPHHAFGTVEVRICDAPTTLEETLTLTALVQSLVAYLSDKIDRGLYVREEHPMIINQNKWRACRFGTEGEFVDFETYRTWPIPKAIEVMVERLAPYARRLGCESYLEGVFGILRNGNGARRQLAVYEKTGSLLEVTRHLIRETGITPLDAE